jgi:hypothetical protein
MRADTLLILALAMTAVPALTQTRSETDAKKSATADTKKSPPVKATEVAYEHPLPRVDFYYHFWDDGEIKVCKKYPNKYVIVCDNNDDDEWPYSLKNLMAQRTPDSALLYASTHARTFRATFTGPVSSAPDPQLSFWFCSKDKVITCGSE